MSGPRFRTNDVWLSDLARLSVDVVCPRCAGPAVVRDRQRLTCTGCGYAAVRRTTCSVWGPPVDPYFRRPLWLRTRWRGHVVWAFNREHLELLTLYVSAGLRERGPGGGNSVMLHRLPRWMTAARHRSPLTAVLKAL